MCFGRGLVRAQTAEEDGTDRQSPLQLPNMVPFERDDDIECPAAPQRNVRSPPVDPRLGRGNPALHAQSGSRKGEEPADIKSVGHYRWQKMGDRGRLRGEKTGL